MSNTLQKIVSFIKNNLLKIVLILGVLVGSYFTYTYFNNKKDDGVKTVKPERSSVVSVVEVTGQVEPSKDAELSFEKSGIVSTVNVKVGDNVKSGQVIATLSGSDASASVREAEAGVQASLATLNQLLQGSSEAEISFKSQNLTNAKADLINAENQVSDTVSNIKNKLSDIVDYKLSDVFYKDNTQYKLTFNSCDQAAQSGLELERANLTAFSVTDTVSAKNEVDSINRFVVSVQKLLSLPCSISDVSLNSKRASVSLVKSDISQMYSEISNRNNSILTAKNAVSRAEKDLELSSSQDKNRIANQKASLNQAYARLSQARAQSGKNILVAPFAGRVSEINVEKGELSAQTKYAFKLISDSSYQIKSKISEIDIAKIKINNTATVTLDAYPNVEFAAIVTSIDPASKNESGVPRYGVTLTFVNYDERIKTGMTSNADIVTETKEGALTIPAAYILIKSGGGIVKVRTIDSQTKEEKIEDKIVKVGIRTQDGKVEVLEGLNENDELVEMAKDGTVTR